MIVPYQRFLERRGERHVLATERRAREQRQTNDVIPTETAETVVIPIERVDEELSHVRFT